LGRSGKKPFVVYIKILPKQLSRRAEENHENFPVKNSNTRLPKQEAALLHLSMTSSEIGLLLTCLDLKRLQGLKLMRI
jgi:hypothetical protein